MELSRRTDGALRSVCGRAPSPASMPAGACPFQVTPGSEGLQHLVPMTSGNADRQPEGFGVPYLLCRRRLFARTFLR